MPTRKPVRQPQANPPHVADQEQHQRQKDKGQGWASAEIHSDQGKGDKGDTVSTASDHIATWAKSKLPSATEFELPSTELPSNADVASTIDDVQESALLRALKNTPLSSTGAGAVGHLETFLQSSKALVEDENEGNLVQEMIEHGTKAAQGLGEKVSSSAEQASSSVQGQIASTFGDDKARAQATAHDTMRRVFEVTKQLISAPEYRDLLRDVAQLLTSWLQHMANASVHVAAGKQAAAKKEGKQAKHDREQVQKQMQTMQDHFKSIAKRLQDHPAWRESVSDVIELFDSFRAHAAELIAEKTKPQRQGRSATKKGAASAALSSSKSEASEGAAGIGLLLPEDDEARKHAELALDKAKKLVANFGGNLEPLQTAARRLIDVLSSKVPEVDELLDGLRKLVLEPTNEKLASDLYRRAQDLVNEEGKSSTDKAAVHGGGDIGGVVTRQQQMRQQQQQQKAQQQQEQKHPQSTAEKDKAGPIRDALMELANSATTFVESLRSDEHLQDAQQSLSALMSELFIDKSTGQAKLKPELGVDVQKLVPALVQSLTALPVARINVATDEMDTIIDNVSLAATVLPKDINVVTETHMSVDSGNMTSTILISLRSVQMEVPNVVFWYNKKTFPTLADVGIADVNIGGSGLDLDLKVIPSNDPNQLLKVVSSEARIGELSLNIKRARHNWMYAIFSSIVERTVADELEKAVAAAMTRVIENFNQTVGETVQKTSAQLSSMSAPQLPELSSITSAIGSGANPGAGEGQDVIQPIKSAIGKAVEAAAGFAGEAMHTEE